MANSNLNTSENIHVKVDQNNIIFIDPNSVVDGTSVVSRNVPQENLMMYVNLEADLIERTVLATSGDPTVKSNLISVAKGMLNMMKNNNGKDFDSNWTEAYFENKKDKDKDGNLTDSYHQNDSTAQSFGIDSIVINVKGASMIPTININFIDVRGKTLFESPKNSPYSAFFHLPWPIFYLTIKGYYGKAIKYRLHLVDFSTRFNESNGNFDISTTFVGSTYAYLNDIPLNGILEAPYLYAIEKNRTSKTNGKNNEITVEVSRNSRGYQMLESVFEEYRQKGYVDKNFKTITLRELIIKAESLDKTIEESIFEGVDPKIFGGLKNFEKLLDDFESQVKLWQSTNLDTNPKIINNKNYYPLKGQDKTKLEIITGTELTTQLNNILQRFKRELKDSANAMDGFFDKGKLPEFKNFKFIYTDKILEINNYIYNDGAIYYVDIEGTQDLQTGILTHIYQMYSSFIEQRNKFQDKIQELVNKVTLDPSKGIGFKPTIGNIFAVLLANADVYVKLLKDVHSRSFEFATERSKKIGKLSDESKNNLNIYPWPQITKVTTANNKRKVLMYPGDPELYKTLESNNTRLWPEVDFVENYVAVSTKRVDAKADKEGGVAKVNLVFEKNESLINTKRISTLFQLTNVNPYINKSIASILSEIWERARYTTFLNSFNNKSIEELANIEFENFKKLTSEDFDIIDILKSLLNVTQQDKQNNVTTTYEKFIKYIEDFSPFERKPYFRDNLPTVPYIQSLLNSPFNLEQYGEEVKFTNADAFYPSLKLNVLNYTAESYRKSIYPFNSNTYLSYLGETKYDVNVQLKLYDFFELNTIEGLVSSPNNLNWYKEGYKNNFFRQRLHIGTNSNVFLLNTPYFHQQLFSDFSSVNPNGKYAGSAYLLLNSLPFLDLRDDISFEIYDEDNRSYNKKSVKMNAMFKELSASHTIPYHLICKWGSLYHRYKRKILDNVDILSGFTTNNITDPIDNHLFFDNYETNTTKNTFDIYSGVSISYTGKTDVGIHPFYDNVFHNIVNGYSFYNNDIGAPDYEDKWNNLVILNRYRTIRSINYWTNFIDNSLMVTGDTFYTLLPCDGANYPESNLVTFDNVEKDSQNGYRILWYSGETNSVDYSGKTFPSPDEYMPYVSGNTDYNDYGLGDDYKKIIDLIGTFSPDILDTFENIFLEFASEKENVEIPNKRFSKVKYDNFQDLLKEIVTIKKSDVSGTNVKSLINQITEKQKSKLELISYNMLHDDNKLKLTLANPKELDLYVIGGFCGLDQIQFDYGKFDFISQSGNTKYIELYIGPYISGTSTNNEYLDFFNTCDVELSEDNVKTFRPLILMYAGGRKDSLFNSKETFIKYLVDNIFSYSTTKNNTNGYINRNKLFIDIFLFRLKDLNKNQESKNQLTLYKGFNMEYNKLEMYNSFKSFNDKWISGNSIGQRLLIEEFLFLDRANRNIGNEAYINLNKLLKLDEANDTESLYSAIGTIIDGSNFMFRALPSYINFYGTNFSPTKTKFESSKNVAKNLFGTFLEVDYQEATPKMILQYMGPTSKYLELEDIQDKMKFRNDSGNLFDSSASPLIITTNDIIKNGDYAKSNKVVAFEVSVGDQAQGMFKSIQLDQATMRNTYASQLVNDNMGRSETGSGVYQVDIGLFDIWRQASYSCEVTMMGNVMIQPTMYFYLKNIPMFRGSYWISEVTHNIKNNNITTSFKGVRIPYASLPDPKESFMLSFRSLFESITNKAIAKIKAEDKDINSKKSLSTKNEKSISTSSGKSVIVDMGPSEKAVKGERLTSDSNITDYGIPYNGYDGEKHIQKVEYKGNQYLRAQAVTMGGPNYQLSDTTEMSIINKMKNLDFNQIGTTSNKLLWSAIKNSNDYFFSTKFDLKKVDASKISKYKPLFLNPLNNKEKSITLTYYDIPNAKVIGAVNVGPSTGNYGIGLSPQLMKDLGLNDGDVVYFTI